MAGVPSIETGAAELRVLSQGAFRGILPIVARMFERASAHTVTFGIFTPGALQARLLSGEIADVAFVSAQRIAAIEQAGRIVAGSRTTLGDAFTAVAVRAGTPKPDLSTPDAVKRAIRAAKSVAISDPGDGAVQGRFVLDLADRFGFDAELRSRFKLVPGGGNRVAEAVVNGEADIGITLSTEIVFVDGAEIGGPLPPNMQNRGLFYAVMIAGTAQPEAAKAFIDFMVSPETKSVMRANGVEPRS